ncbi:MAG: metallophosphoesterase family protein [Anaerolineales bacterium]
MRVLVFSDIHANLTALESVLSDAGEFDAAWCLGDVVGYGPDPNECIDRIRLLPNLTCIVGNHDAAVLELIETEAFNHEAKKVIYWTQSALTDASFHFLRQLPQKVVIDNITLVHGSPRQPVWEYLLDSQTAGENFRYFDTDFCFVGHTHLPSLFYLEDGENQPFVSLISAGQSFQLIPRSILNPGSVGQPRDRDPRASYAIFDTETLRWESHRVGYDILSVQERMRIAGLPHRHIQRLAGGW